MKKYLLVSLVAVMALGSVAPTFASQDREREQENRGRGISEEVKKELKSKQEDGREDRQEDRRNDQQKRKDLEKSLKFAPRAITFVGKLTAVSNVALTSTTPSTTITVNVTKVMPKRPKQMSDLAVVYPEVNKSLVLTVTNKTSLVKGFWGKMKLSDMSVGDEVRVVAKFNKDGSLSVVSLKDNSLHMLSGKKGTIESLDTVNKTFVFKQEKRSLVVKTDSETKFVWDNAGTHMTVNFTDLKVGNVVKVQGVVNTNLNTVKASSVNVKIGALAQ